MVVASVLCMALMSGPIKFWKKVVLGFLVFIYLWAMLTTGTRGAYVLVPVTLVLYAIFKFNRRVLRLGIAGAVMIVILIFIPTSNPTLYRFQSAFKPSEDASFNVRKANQKRIQPYILTHPMGGGLGATGAWGQRFAPNSYLANFPPDSGYVRVAVELGWIGLGLFCTLMFIILKTGINHYYAIRDPELKTYCMAMTLIVFAFNIGNYPQEALVQFPSNIYFYLVTALITVTYQLDKQKNPQLHAGK
jgi:O-antigen ligase